MNSRLEKARQHIQARNWAIVALLLALAWTSTGWHYAAQTRDINAAVAQTKDLEVFDLKVKACVEDRVWRRLVGHPTMQASAQYAPADEQVCHMAVLQKELEQSRQLQDMVKRAQKVL